MKVFLAILFLILAILFAYLSTQVKNVTKIDSKLPAISAIYEGDFYDFA